MLYYLSGLELEHVKLLMKYAIRPAKLRLRKLDTRQQQERADAFDYQNDDDVWGIDPTADWV